MELLQTALVFPGQGSQIVGMGHDIAAAFPTARDLFQQADDLLQFSLSTLCFGGPEETLTDTVNTQPALFVTSMAILRALEAQLGPLQPAAFAGHSLGELTALCAAGAVTFEDGLRLVRERGRLMKQAGEQSPGAMAAVLGLDVPAVRAVCEQASAVTGRVLVVANDNCPGQIVISGDAEALEAGVKLAKEAGAKRALKLAVSIASHSPLMSEAAASFASVLGQVSFQATTAPVYVNVTAAPVQTEQIASELGDQLTHPVRWTESVQNMITAGITNFVEIGSKDVLSGLVRRIDPAVSVATVNSVDSLEAFVQSSKGQPV